MSFGEVPEPLNKTMSGGGGSGNHADRVAAGNEALVPGAD